VREGVADPERDAGGDFVVVDDAVCETVAEVDLVGKGVTVDELVGLGERDAEIDALEDRVAFGDLDDVDDGETVSVANDEADCDAVLEGVLDPDEDVVCVGDAVADCVARGDLVCVVVALPDLDAVEDGVDAFEGFEDLVADTDNVPERDALGDFVVVVLPEDVFVAGGDGVPDPVLDDVLDEDDEIVAEGVFEVDFVAAGVFVVVVVAVVDREPAGDFVEVFVGSDDFVALVDFVDEGEAPLDLVLDGDIVDVLVGLDDMVVVCDFVAVFVDVAEREGVFDLVAEGVAVFVFVEVLPTSPPDSSLDLSVILSSSISVLLL
jgi:hypothetical protein